MYPYPVDSGKRVVLSGLLAYWRSRLPAGDVHYVQVSSADPPTVPPDFTYHRIPAPGTAVKLGNLARYTAVRRSKAIQESLLYSPAVRDRLSDVLAGIGAELEVFDTVRMAQYAPLVRRAGGRQIAYLDDLFSVRYERMLAAMAQHPEADLNVLGEFAPVVPGPLRTVIRRRRVQKAVLRVEQRLVARSEDRVARELPRSLLVNAEETRLLRARSGSDRVETMPPLLGVPDTAARRDYAGRPDFVFLGLLTLPHNDVAVRSFLAHQLPAVRAVLPGARLRIVGRGASEQLHADVAKSGGSATLEGYVPDLDRLLSQACALLNPLLFGTGVKLKVLEALSRGLPVLSTSVGAEGVASGRADGCVVEDDLASYPQRMTELTDVAVNTALSRAALQHFADTYSRAAVHATYDRLFGASGA